MKLIDKKLLLFSTLLIFSPFLIEEALASSDPPLEWLPWKPKTETLEYQSCGCADRCWVATVKNKKTNRQIARLRCDCKTLFSKISARAETVLESNCHEFENDDKFEKIPAALNRLLHH